MTDIEDELERAEQTLRAARQFMDSSPDDPALPAAVVTRALEAMRRVLKAMHLAGGGERNADAPDEQVIVALTQRAGMSGDWVKFYYNVESREMSFAYGFELKLSRGALEKTLSGAEEFIGKARQVLADAAD